MTNAAQKTPISLLQELCAQQQMTPDYKLMSVEGAVHAPTFMYRVQVNEVVATATGQSKKKAKHAAAKAVLERLLGKDGEFNQGFQSDGVTVNAETLNEIIAEPVAAPVIEDNAEDNPVGKLQEHCMKNRWQPPYYETENAIGLPHEKIFTIVCYVEGFSTTGEGKSKRLAKRQAAAKMLERLNSMKDVSQKEEEMAKGNTNEDEAVANNSSNVDVSESSTAEAVANSSSNVDVSESSTAEAVANNSSNVDMSESSTAEAVANNSSNVDESSTAEAVANISLKVDLSESSTAEAVANSSSNVDTSESSTAEAVAYISLKVDVSESSTAGKIEDIQNQSNIRDICETISIHTRPSVNCELLEDDKI